MGGRAGNIQSLLVSIGHIGSVCEEAVVKAGFYVPDILAA